jgi:dihydrofolate reductase
MRKIVVLTFVSMDGVMQAPGGPQEDTSGDFRLGGWTVPYFDEVVVEEMGRQMGHRFDLLLGRRTYDLFASYWPHATGPAADAINEATKYVATTRPLSVDWKNTVRLEGDAAGAIRALKEGSGPQIQVHGSGALIQTLLEHDLADEFWLKIFPVTLGGGRRLFGEGTRPAGFALVQSGTSPSGVILARYARAGEVRTGSVPPPS